MDPHYAQALRLYAAVCLEFCLERDLPQPDWEHLETLHQQRTDLEAVLAACQLDRLV